MIQHFTVFRSHPMGKRKLLTVALDGDKLCLHGNANLIRSLKQKGVDDLVTRTHFDLGAIVGQASPHSLLAFQALKRRFSLDSAYIVE